MAQSEYGVGFYFLILIISSCSATPVSDLSKAINDFANGLYLQCVKEKPGNVIVSPLSVVSALALLSQGIGGRTYNQLGLSGETITIPDQHNQHREALEQNAGKATLSFANGVFVQQGHQLNKNFHDVAVSKFKSDVQLVNFAESEESAEIINHFVEEKTNGKIKKLFNTNHFTSDTRLVLANAIYFKGAWEKPFNKDFTAKLDFYNSETEKVQVNFMYKDSDFNSAYLKELEATALELNYANSNLSFVIVLPNSRTGLAALEAKLQNYDLAKITEQLQPNRYEIRIPKFKVEYEIQLKEVLKKLGLTDVFTGSSNLSAILDSNEQLKVSDVAHKVAIEIDEQGSEAAGATGLDVVAISLPPEFHADHPFMYLIRDKITNTIIFSGRISKL